MVGLTVDKRQFINAVELLRQNGFPRQRFITVDELFPANQLVTSPTQEQAKMVFLKEQQLENMLSHMDGVIHADVTVAMPMSVDGKTRFRIPPRCLSSIRRKSIYKAISRKSKGWSAMRFPVLITPR